MYHVPLKCVYVTGLHFIALAFTEPLHQEYKTFLITNFCKVSMHLI